MKKYFKYYFYKLFFLSLLRGFKKMSLFKKTLIVFSFLAVVFVISAIFYFANFFVELIYDPEIERSFNRNTLVFFVSLPLILVFFSFIVLVRGFISFLSKKSFQQLKFKFIGFFFIGVFVPASFYIFLFERTFDSFINIVDNQAVFKTLEIKLWNLRLKIREDQEQLDIETVNRIENKSFNLNSSSLIDIFINYDEELSPVIILKREAIKNIPRINFNLFIAKNENFFSSYDKEYGYIFNLYHYPKRTNPYFLAIQYVDEDTKENIQETLKLINEVRQFQDVLPTFKNGVFFIFLYLFIQLFSLTVVFFYYRFSRYFSPIDKLSKSTIELSKGDFNPPYLAQLKRIENNEFKELIEAFHRLVSELRSNRRRLKRLSQIEAWREVVKRIAHEIKNPLTPIKLATNQIEESLIKSDIKTYEKLSNNFNFIYFEIERIESLIKDISLFPKFSLSKKFISVNTVFNKIESYLARYPQIFFLKEIDEVEGLKLVIDPEKIYQAILNLVKNSVESLNEGKSLKKVIMLHARINQQEKNKSYLEIKIKDNGRGINLKKKEDIFKPYVTTKKAGSGLGLSISEEIIHLHEGKIDLIFEKNWTVFSLMLPVLVK